MFLCLFLFNCHGVRIFDVVHTTTAPLAPVITPEDCLAENNSVTVSWKPPNKSFVEGYVLELDDGNGGEFRVSLSFHTRPNGPPLCILNEVK